MIARACAVPRDALLHDYVSRAGTYTDCFEVMHPLEADLEAFIMAFYTTWLFRLERAVLTLALRRRIRDEEVRALSEGNADSFAAWTVVAREPAQLLLSDINGGTRSYLAAAKKEGGTTRLLFGSAVLPGKDGNPTALTQALLPFHRLYARLLLRLAERKMRRG